MRYDILDGLRGYLLLVISAIHFNFTFQSVAGTIHHNSLGFGGAAQGFVFLSGLVAGIVYTRTLKTRGAPAMRRKLLRRALTIYIYYAILMVGCLAAALLLNEMGVHHAYLQGFDTAPAWHAAFGLSLLYAPTLVDILAMYVWFMLAAPIVLLAIDRGHGLAVLLTSLALWAFAQTGLGAVSFSALAQVFPIRFGIFFNVFAWQILFVVGLYLGALWAKDQLNLERLRTPAYTWVFGLSVAACLIYAFWDRAIAFDWISEGFSNRSQSGENRRLLSQAYLLNFAAQVFLVTWLLTAGRASASKVFRALSALVRWFFTLRPLVFLGRHSLEVFFVHVIFAYLFEYIWGDREIGEPAASFLLLVCLPCIFLGAALHQRWRTRQRLGSS